jgi:hypothetical protein
VGYWYNIDVFRSEHYHCSIYVTTAALIFPLLRRLFPLPVYNVTTATHCSFYVSTGRIKFSTVAYSFPLLGLNKLALLIV